MMNLDIQEQQNFDNFVSHFEKLSESGEETICKCPSCGKKKLYISVKNSSVLMTCFHGCDYKDILSAAMLEPKDLYLKKTKRPLKSECCTVREHIYTDKDGAPRFKKTISKFFVFWEYNGKQRFPGDKETFWERFDDASQSYVKGGSCKLLYHLDKLTGDTVYIPEGEKDVETLESMGFIATTNGGGASEQWSKGKYLEQLKGIKTAVILADNDTAGTKHAQSVAEYLTGGGIACKIVEAPAIYSEVKQKGDISDIAAIIGADKAKERLMQAVSAAAIYQRTAEPSKDKAAETENPYNADGLGRLSIKNLEAAMQILDIHIKMNKINHQIEYSGSGIASIDPAGINATIPHILYDKLQYHLKGCNAEKIAAFLNTMAYDAKNEYNPILEAINNTVWDGKDHLQELCDLMNIASDDKLSKALLRKWLMQCYCGLYNTLQDPFSLDLTLVLVGKQGYGKTRLFEKLAIKRKYFGEGATLDPRDKDSKMQATSRWITELGEIGSTMKKEIDALKAFISKATDVNRPPYGRSEVEHPRLTSFCGTTNDTQFLIDETGNRRYATIKLPDDKSIDIKSRKFLDYDALQLWAQIAEIVSQELKNGETYATAFRLSQAEHAALEERNKSHAKPLKGEQECSDILADALNPGADYITEYRFLTPTQFKAENNDVLRPYSSEQIGKCLNRLGYTTERKKIGGKSVRAYNLPCKKLNRSYEYPYPA